ncbi:MAG TPA: restriction endonuclease subunit S, partial [Candidatus Nitrosotalea sp.]|nr:restriction endonuclease subunit S [Candidatus Nitrosotalea sp.]
MVLEKNNTLPNGWKTVEIKDLFLNPKQDIVDGPFGSNLKASEYVEKGIPLIRLQNVDRNLFIDKNIRYISEEKAEQLKRHDFISNDIVITKLGVPVGKACLVPGYLKNGIIVADIIRMRLNHDLISKKYLVYIINSDEVIRQFAKHTKGTTRPRVNLGQIRNFLISLPPLNEQKRIVSKIEELFSQNENTIKSLKNIKFKLKEYRSSILEAAFIGKLVPNDSSHESSTKRWCIQSRPLEDENLPQIPSNWCYRKLRELSERVSVGYVGPTTQYYCDKTIGIPFLRSQNIRPARINFEGIRYITKEFHHKLRKSQLLEGDLVIVRVGANRGDTCIIPSDIGQVNCANVVFARLFKGISEYLNYYFQSRICQNTLSSMTTGSAQGVINTKSVAEVPVPIPPLSEQEKIVTKIEEVFSVINHLEQSIDEAIGKSKKMNKLILS